MIIQTISEFKSTFAGLHSELRGSAYSETISCVRFADAQSEFTFTFEAAENKQFKVTMSHPDFGDIITYSRTQTPKFVAIVKCPVDTKYEIKDKDGKVVKADTIPAGRKKIAFY
jgi:hypothetical protein